MDSGFSMPFPLQLLPAVHRAVRENQDSEVVIQKPKTVLKLTVKSIKLRGAADSDYTVFTFVI